MKVIRREATPEQKARAERRAREIREPRAVKLPPGRHVMPAILPWLACLILLVGCGEARQLNPGAHTAWIECPASDLNAIMPVTTEVMPHGFRQTWCMGYCDADGRCIRVWSKAPEYAGAHEFCHLIDCYRGDWIAARASLGSGVPDSVDEFCASLSHSARWPGYQWAALAARYPHEPVILHPEKLALIAQRGAQP